MDKPPDIYRVINSRGQDHPFDKQNHLALARVKY